jgi:ABC-type bacteriocin/lantibiotic exporter with double-glycine peptidase domain
VRAVVLFSVVRVIVFVVPFGILFAIGLEWWVAALVAAVLGFCVSYIFLRPLRDRVALKIVEARGTQTASADEAAEDGPPAPPGS